MKNTKSWTNYFITDFENGDFSGFVPNLNSAKSVIRDYSYATSSIFINRRNTANFGESTSTAALKKRLLVSHHIFFKCNKSTHGNELYLNGIPFVVLGQSLLECHYGPSHRKETSKSETDNSCVKKRRKCKKRGCPATIYMRELVAFPQYKITLNSVHFRSKTSLQLRADLQSSNAESVEMKSYIHINLPQENAHQGHSLEVDPNKIERSKKHLRDILSEFSSLSNCAKSLEPIDLAISSIKEALALFKKACPSLPSNEDVPPLGTKKKLPQSKTDMPSKIKYDKYSNKMQIKRKKNANSSTESNTVCTIQPGQPNQIITNLQGISMLENYIHPTQTYIPEPHHNLPQTVYTISNQCNYIVRYTDNVGFVREPWVSYTRLPDINAYQLSNV